MPPVTDGSEHACEHPIVAGRVGAEGNEVQAVFRHGSARDAAAKDLGLLAADVDGNARDVRGRGLGSVTELDAIGLVSADDALLLLHRELVERPEVAHPAHHEEVTPALSRLIWGHERHVGGAERQLSGRG